MQASSDIFLGWLHVEAGLDGKARDFYGRQLKDWKGSAEVERMIPKGLAAYGRLCGWTLARAHARSGDRDRDRRLSRQGQQLRPRDPRVLPRLRRAERARLQGAHRGGRVRPDHRRDRPLRSWPAQPASSCLLGLRVLLVAHRAWRSCRAASRSSSAALERAAAARRRRARRAASADPLAQRVGVLTQRRHGSRRLGIGELLGDLARRTWAPRTRGR